MKKTKPEIYALVDKIHDNNWTPIFRWADSISRNFTGKFSTIDDVINDIPQNIKKIILQYVDDNGKEINKIIDRNVPC